MALNLTALFSRWSFIAKSRLFMLMFSIGVIAIGVLAGRAILDLTGKFTTSVEKAQINLDAATTARVSIVAMQEALYRLALAKESSTIREAAVSAIRSAYYLDDSLQNLSRLLPDNEKVKALRRHNEIVRPIQMEIIKHGMHNDVEISLNKLNQLSPVAAKIDELSAAIFIDEQKRLIIATKESTEQGKRTIWLLAGIIVFILIITFIVVVSNLKLQTNRQRYIDELKQTNRKLEEARVQLLQTEKMASIGQLAAGVAHEINNPIGFVSSNINTLERYINDIFMILSICEKKESSSNGQDASAQRTILSPRQRGDLDFYEEDVPILIKESRDGLLRVKKIVENLKGFSRVDASNELQYVDIENELESTLAVVNSELEPKATVIKEFCGLPQVQCFPSELNQVFLNMLVNAAQAIEEKGTITIRTGKEEDRVWIEIADSGEGIPPKNLDKIFDPFFTTRPIGMGTGLGLSVAYGIIKKHNGIIDVDSVVGRGTVFRIWLPFNTALV